MSLSRHDTFGFNPGDPGTTAKWNKEETKRRIEADISRRLSLTRCIINALRELNEICIEHETQRTKALDDPESYYDERDKFRDWLGRQL